MRLRSIVEDKEFFDYTELSREMWREKIHDAQDEQGISFDLENDDDITDRTIKIDQDQWDTTDCRFNCQLCAAGGDWQRPVYYFRCQLTSGYALDISEHGDPHFIYIPGKNEGNPGLQTSSKGSKATWIAPDNDDDDSPEPEERKCWESLKKHLKDLVDKEIKKVKSGDY